MLSTRSLYILAALVCAAGARSAQFIGCANNYPTGAPTLTVTADPYASCNLFCKDYAYSFTKVPNADAAPTTCACANTLSSTNTDYDTATGPKMCAVGDYAIQDIDTEYEYGMCYDKTSGMTWVNMQPDQCYGYCKSAEKSYTLTSQDESGQWQCGCSDTAPTASASTNPCGGHNTYYSYHYDVHNPQPSHDPKHKRKLKERLAKKRREVVHDLCPKRMVACRVEGVDAYECLDISSELESCGGCMFGIYTTAKTPTPPKDAIVGSDCSILPGIPMGAVTCSSGKCAASACKSGWSLVGGRCVRMGKKVKRSK